MERLIASVITIAIMFYFFPAFAVLSFVISIFIAPLIVAFYILKKPISEYITKRQIRKYLKKKNREMLKKNLRYLP